MQPRILVVGTGAIGGFYGGKLAQAGALVSTLCRSDYEFVKSKYSMSVTAFNKKLMEEIEVFKGKQTYPDDFTILCCKFS